MRRHILNLEQQLPWFNRWPMTKDLFQEICEQENIAVYKWVFPPKVKGFYFKENDGAVIGINHTLKHPENTIVACRELGHHFLEHPNGFTLETETPDMIPTLEFQAKVFGALCLIPTPDLERDGDDALLPWPITFREFRWRVYQDYLAGYDQNYDQNGHNKDILRNTG